MDRNGNGMTVKEFANAAGVSVQAIYKRLHRDGDPIQAYVMDVDGMKIINSAGLIHVGVGKTDGNDATGLRALSEDPEVIILRKQLEEKDRQISSLLSVIHELTSIIQGGQHGQ